MPALRPQFRPSVRGCDCGASLQQGAPIRPSEVMTPTTHHHSTPYTTTHATTHHATHAHTHTHVFHAFHSAQSTPHRDDKTHHPRPRPHPAPAAVHRRVAHDHGLAWPALLQLPLRQPLRRRRHCFDPLGPREPSIVQSRCGPRRRRARLGHLARACNSRGRRPRGVLDLGLILAMSPALPGAVPPRVASHGMPFFATCVAC